MRDRERESVIEDERERKKDQQLTRFEPMTSRGMHSSTALQPLPVISLLHCIK